jgi:ribosomal protein S18 acetylase RimI-like enzyme
MLTAAVCGDVFASPSVDAVLAGLLAVTGPAGCLLIVKNYTGDRLNFGLAAERARALGLKVNMVIVDEAMRGRGLGRKLMDAAMKLAGDRPLRLVATAEGLPLYEKLGFRQTGRILQHQGIAAELAAPMATSAAAMTDFSAITELDRQAFGADRADLIAYLAKVGELAVVRRNGRVTGFAVLRSFGRGEVIGPVIAGNLEDAKALVAHFIALRPGVFLRVDTTAAAGLSGWLAEQGFAHVGGGIAMMKPSIPVADSAATIFALANQALG